MLWDLPIVVPPLVMHYINYRPQFKIDQEVLETENHKQCEDDYGGECLESVTKRPTWLKKLASDDSINQIDEDFLDMLASKEKYEKLNLNQPTFEITNDAFEYSGLLRMIQSNREESSTLTSSD